MRMSTKEIDPISNKRTRRHQETGQELVEFALLLPFLLLLMLGILEFGNAVFIHATLSNAAREIARYGIVHPSAEALDAYVAEQLAGWTAGLDSDRLGVETAILDAPIRETVQVTLTYDYPLISGPVIEAAGGNPTLRLRAFAAMNTE